MLSVSKFPAFEFLTLQELKKNYYAQLKGALEKKYGSEDNFPHERKKQSDLIAHTIAQLENYGDKIPKEEKQLVLVGLNRHIKKAIANSYWVRSPEHSVLYKALDGAIGITDKNILDAKTEQAAIKAYKLFEKRLGLDFYNKVFASEDYKKLKSVLSGIDKANLKVLSDNEKAQEKNLKDTMNIKTGEAVRLTWTERAKNKKIDDNHDLSFYGLKRNFLFFISPISSKEAQKKQQQQFEDNAQEFLNKIKL